MTIFHQLLTPNVTEGHVVPAVDELKDSAFSLVLAGSETVGNAMTITTHHVALNRDIREKLAAELKKAFPDPNAKLEFLTLEKLPYLVCTNLLK